MNPSTKDEIKGNLNEVKGKVKETAGRVTNNPDLEAVGIAEYNAGKVGKRIGQVKKGAREVDKDGVLSGARPMGLERRTHSPFPAQYCRDLADRQLGGAAPISAPRT